MFKAPEKYGILVNENSAHKIVKPFQLVFLYTP